MAVGLGEGRALAHVASAAGRATGLGRALPRAADDTLVAAHRGIHSGIAPYENTLPAFRKAIDARVDKLELDVQRTLDGVLVAHHDTSIGSALISATRFADLPRLPDGSTVTPLRDVVDLAADRGARLLVELKVGADGGRVPAETVSEVVHMLRGRLPRSQFEVFSFDLDAMRAVKQLDPSIRTGALFRERPRFLSALPWKLPTAGQLVRRAQGAGADFVGLRTTLARDRIVQRFHDAGFDTYVWTANDAPLLDRLIRDSRIATIITDHPQRAMDLRRAAGRVAPDA